MFTILHINILSDAEKNKNKVIVVYDVATGEKNVIRQPRNSQSLEFKTVEVISRDSVLSVKRLWCLKIFCSNSCKASN
jgi:hypothetical protein